MDSNSRFQFEFDFELELELELEFELEFEKLLAPTEIRFLEFAQFGYGNPSI